MFELFTDRARKVMGLANQEAKRFNQEFISPDHLLLALLLDGDGVGV
jgi:ATP-dependent Clp protease ATP-binding subunit ClpC